MSKIHAERWKEFHKANPAVWELFNHFTEEVIAAGHKRYSADAIMHRVRWETSVRTTSAPIAGRILKINDHHVAYYARLWLYKNGKTHPNFFTLRNVAKAKASAAAGSLI